MVRELCVCACLVDGAVCANPLVTDPHFPRSYSAHPSSSPPQHHVEAFRRHQSQFNSPLPRQVVRPEPGGRLPGSQDPRCGRSSPLPTPDTNFCYTVEPLSSSSSLPLSSKSLLLFGYLRQILTRCAINTITRSQDIGGCFFGIEANPSRGKPSSVLVTGPRSLVARNPKPKQSISW